jgi:Fur family ferric uptake transcriptional regulator
MEQLDHNLIEELKTRGMRVTPQRAIIFEAIEKLEGHITAEDIYSEVQKINSFISLATVYRTLELLHEMSLITPTNLGGSQTYYALKGHGAHHHLVCLECGAIEEFDDDLFDLLRRQVGDQYGFDVQTDHMSLFGVCRTCQKN